jgi:hypothetical protein
MHGMISIKKVTGFVSVFAFSVCAVSVWLHILTLGVCVSRIGQGCTVQSDFVTKTAPLLNQYCNFL